MAASREHTLAETLAHAADSLPYYAPLGCAGKTLRLEDFPIVDAATVAECPESFYRLERFPDFLLTSGGTTGRVPSFFPVNYDELDTAMRARLDGAPRTADGWLSREQFDGVALHLTDLQHGLLLPPAHGQPVVCLPLEVGRHLPLIRRFLRDGIVVDSTRYDVVELFGSIVKLRALTRYLETVGENVAGTSIRRITTMAFHTSSTWRRQLSRSWNADVVESYGLTEFVQSVTRTCPACAAFHLPPTVHEELIALDLSGPVHAGPALLVLTALYPYRTSMPLIRYNTHDVVEPLRPCRLTSTNGLMLHGRDTAVLVNEGRVAVTALDALDAVDAVEASCPGSIAYDESVATVMSWGSGCNPEVFRDAGYAALSCRCVEEGRTEFLAVDVEVHGPEASRARVREVITEHLAARVMQRGIQDAAAASFRVRALRPGSLAREDLQITLI
jgi:hypothetical protein